MTSLTEERARTKRCPMPMGVMHDPDVQYHCIASDCMAWRWRDKAPSIPRRNIWTAGERDEELLRSPIGPTRPPEVPEAADWLPMTGSDDSEDWDGGHWQERQADYDQRVAAARDARTGFCGAFGAPVPERQS
jgi:hypothetical protein